MASNNRLRKYNLEPITKVVDFKWEGVPLGLTPAQAQILARIVAGPLPSRQDSKSLSVLISGIRRILEDIGFPLTIKNIQGHKEGNYIIE